MELSDDQVKLVIAAIGILSGVLVVVLSALIARQSEQRDRRRELYAEAYRAVLEWHEMLYRVRRRSSDPNDVQTLRDRFHGLQERISFYEGWIGSESVYMRHSYCLFVQDVRDRMRPLIEHAWGKATRARRRNGADDDERPDVGGFAEKFLRDVRGHLSWQPWRRIAVVWRHRRWFGGSRP